MKEMLESVGGYGCAAYYHDIGLLKAIAGKHGVAVLPVHHLRKQNDDDPMNMVSGTICISCSGGAGVKPRPYMPPFLIFIF